MDLGSFPAVSLLCFYDLIFNVIYIFVNFVMHLLSLGSNVIPVSIYSDMFFTDSMFMHAYVFHCFLRRC